MLSVFSPLGGGFPTDLQVSVQDGIFVLSVIGHNLCCFLVVKKSFVLGIVEV